MSTLFILLFLASIIVLIVGLVKPSKIKLESRKKVWQWCGSAAIVCMVLGAITAPKTPQTTPQGASTATQAAAAPQTSEDRIKALAAAVFTTKVSYVGTDVDSDPTDLPDGAPVGSTLITVKLNVSSYYSKSSVMNDTGKLSGQIFQEVFASNPKAYNATVSYYSDLTDKYGNTTNGVMLSHSMDKDTYGKINWQNFDSTTLCDFLRSENQHLTNGNLCEIDASNLQ